MKKEYKIIIMLLAILTVINVIPLEDSASKITIVGSSSVQPLCEQLVEEYKKTTNNTDINVQGGGSSLGIKCANQSVADIGMSSKEIQCKDLKEHEIGKEAIVVIVNNKNPINDISTEELQEIFSGKIKNWNEISNKSGKINVITREEGSGTLDSFKKTIMKNNSIKKDAIVQNSAGSIKQSVMHDENAIGFVSLIHIDKQVKNLSIDKITPSDESVMDGSYKLQRPFILLTNQKPNNHTTDFINWIKSNESQEIFNREKIIRVG